MRYRLADKVRQDGMDEYGFGPRVMKGLKVCKSCGRISPSTLLFCTECGAKLPEKNLYQSYKERHKCCKVCETVVANSSDYCPQCGEKLQKTLHI